MLSGCYTIQFRVILFVVIAIMSLQIFGVTRQTVGFAKIGVVGILLVLSCLFLSKKMSEKQVVLRQ